MRLSSCGSSVSNKVTEAFTLVVWEELKTSTSNISNHNGGKLGNREICAFGILSLDIPEQKKGNFKVLLKYIFRLLNSEEVGGCDDGGSSCYVKLHDHLRVSFSRKALHLSVSNKNLKCVNTACLTVTNFPRILFAENRQLCWWFLPKISYHKRRFSIFWKNANAFIFNNGFLLDRYGGL